MGQLDIKVFQQPTPQPEIIKPKLDPLYGSNSYSLDGTLAPGTSRPVALTSHPNKDECRYRDGDILPPSHHQQQQLSIPTILRGLDLLAPKTRADLISLLTNQLPKNDYGLPKYILRSDLLDHLTFQQPQEDPQTLKLWHDLLNSAIVQLQYHEGYPSLPNGAPFWFQLEFESQHEFDLFNRYMRLPGARQLALISNEQDKLQEIREMFHLNYWGFRCLAHDTFAVIHEQRLREQRILTTTNKHYLEAEKMMGLLLSHVNDLDWAEVKDPEKFVNILDKLSKLQRVALNLPATGAVAEPKTPQTPNIELLMRRITEQNIRPVEEGENTGAPQVREDLKQQLQDPEFVRVAQELILRMSIGNS